MDQAAQEQASYVLVQSESTLSRGHTFAGSTIMKVNQYCNVVSKISAKYRHEAELVKTMRGLTFPEKRRRLNDLSRQRRISKASYYLQARALDVVWGLWRKNIGTTYDACRGELWVTLPGGGHQKRTFLVLSSDGDGDCDGERN